MHQHVKKQHSRRDLSIRFNDQVRTVKKSGAEGESGGDGVSERRAYL